MKLNVVYRAFVTPTLLSFIIDTGSKRYGFMSYQPQLVARQFGLGQMLPMSLFSHHIDIVWVGRQFFIDEHLTCLKFHRMMNDLELHVFHFQPSFFTTKEFDQ